MTARRLANPRNVPAARQGIHLGIVPDSAAARSLRRGPDREIARPPDAFAPDRKPMTGPRVGESVHHAACRAAGRGICAQPRHLPGQEVLFASVWRRGCSLRHGCATVCRQSAWLLHAHYVPATNPHHGTGNFIIPGGDPCDNTAPALASLQAGPSSAADPGPLFQGLRTGFHATSGAHSRRLGCRHA